MIKHSLPVSCPLGLSGSLQTTSDGVPYLVGGSGVSVSTGSNGQVTLAADSTVARLTGATFTGRVNAPDLRGTLQLTTSGSSYLVASGAYTQVTSSSNGQVTIFADPPRLINARYHDTSLSPTALWQLSGSLADTSGNSLGLAVASGSARYGEILPGIRGLVLQDTTIIRTPSTVGLRGLTSYSFEAIVNIPRPYTDKPIFSHGNSGGGANNYSYYFGVANEYGDAETYWQSGSGGDAYGQVIQEILLPLRPCHLAVTRNDDYTLSVYVDGQNVYSVTTGLPKATLGTGGRFRLGSHDATAHTMLIASAKFFDRALTPAEVRAEYNMTLGPVYGMR